MAMSARQVFEGLLTELSKANAPSMLLQDFNYFFNKAVNQYINKRYNIYDIGQQTTDDLRVLKATTILEPTKIIKDNDTTSSFSKFKNFGAGLSKLFGATYEVNLPLDYLHMLNCVCIYELDKRYKCYNAGDLVQFAAKRLTADSWSVIVNDFYNRPLPERPYYYIHNVNQSVSLPTNPINTNNASELDKDTYGTDVASDYGVYTDNEYKYVEANVKEETFKTTDGLYYVQEVNSDVAPASVTDQLEPIDPPSDNGSSSETKYIPVTEDDEWDSTIIYYTREIVKSTITTKACLLPRTISLDGITNNSLVEREAGVRYGNSSNVRMEIRYGHDDSVFKLVGVFVDYIKAPQTIRLTQELVNLTEDTSQLMEFPDYVCQEIINELVHLVMENTADPRLQTHIPVTQSIANPAQQQTPQQTNRG